MELDPKDSKMRLKRRKRPTDHELKKWAKKHREDGNEWLAEGCEWFAKEYPEKISK